MFRKIILLIAILFLFNSVVVLAQSNDLTCKEIVLKSLKSIREVKGLKYHLKIVERGRKGFNNYESWVKFIRSPRQIYLYIKGIEVLWVQGNTNGKALVKPGSFIFFNLNLDPMGDLMRQDQHHTLNEMGYDYFATIIQNTVERLGNRFDEFFNIIGEEKINGRWCYKILIDNRDFRYNDYTIGEGENITSIARKFFIPEYLILEKNKKFKDYFDILTPGKIISIPNWYCRTVTLYVDKFYFLPICVRINDDKGLFEEYNYHFLQVNPVFEEGEFTKKYKGYGF